MSNKQKAIIGKEFSKDTHIAADSICIVSVPYTIPKGCSRIFSASVFSIDANGYCFDYAINPFSEAGIIRVHVRNMGDATNINLHVYAMFT